MLCCNDPKMGKRDWLPLIELLKQAGLEFEKGLTDLEVEQVERTFSFRFPPDLCAFIKTAVPFWNSPRWRTGSESEIREWFDEPIRGILFDVEHSEFWLPEWGERPVMLSMALEIATSHIREAPKLIPILAGRYLPELPHEAGNPVFSVHQADIIYYGFDLDDYFRHEFSLPRREWPMQIREVEFWNPDRFQELRWA